MIPISSDGWVISIGFFLACFIIVVILIYGSRPMKYRRKPVYVIHVSKDIAPDSVEELEALMGLATDYGFLPMDKEWIAASEYNRRPDKDEDIFIHLYSCKNPHAVLKQATDLYYNNEIR